MSLFAATSDYPRARPSQSLTLRPLQPTLRPPTPRSSNSSSGTRSKFILADAEKAGQITAEARQADAAKRKATGRAIDLGDEVQAGGFTNDPGHLKAMIEKGEYTPMRKVSPHEIARMLESSTARTRCDPVPIMLERA